MANNDDLLKRLGELSREREREADEELRAPSIQLPDPVALREAIVKQALEKARPLPSNVQPIRRTPVLWVGGIVAAAAALLLIWIGVREQAPLPRYALLQKGAIEQQRGDETEEVLRVRAGSTVTLELKPAQDVKGDVELRLFAQKGDELTRLQPQTIERSESGAFRLNIQVGPPLSDTTGEVTLSVLLCRPQTCEQAQAALRNAAETEKAAWQILRLPTVFAD